MLVIDHYSEVRFESVPGMDPENFGDLLLLVEHGMNLRMRNEMHLINLVITSVNFHAGVGDTFPLSSIRSIPDQYLCRFYESLV